MWITWVDERCLIVLPEVFRQRVMRAAHEGLGHCGVCKAKEIVKRHFVWPSLSKDMTAYCHSCPQC